MDIYTVLRERDTGDRVIGQRARISMAQCIIGQPALAPYLLSVCKTEYGPSACAKGVGLYGVRRQSDRHCGSELHPGGTLERQVCRDDSRSQR